MTAAGLPRWWRRLVPRAPTRDGWWFIGTALGLGLAGVNTGNNLVYLLCSMLLAFIFVSGVLSELSLRGLRVTAVLPEAIYAGRPALFGTVVRNDKHRLASHWITVEVLGADATARRLHIPRLPAGGERLLTWDATLPARGRHRLSGLRLTTQFPFGLFVKGGPILPDAEVVVYPAVGPVPARVLSRSEGADEAGTRRRGRGDDLYNLRQYRPGDDPRLIHWRTSARAGTLTVREFEEDTARDVRLVLEGTGAGDAARLEHGLSEAASLAVHFLRAGASVELVGPGILVPLGRGRGQEVRILTALALYDPATAEATGRDTTAPGRTRPLRELRVGLD